MGFSRVGLCGVTRSRARPFWSGKIEAGRLITDGALVKIRCSASAYMTNGTFKRKGRLQETAFRGSVKKSWLLFPSSQTPAA